MLILTQKPGEHIAIYYQGKLVGTIHNAGKTRAKLGLTLPPEYKVLRSSLSQK